jgi:L-2-hydroxycarboxylate dehydrogenase (NAD+)
MALRLLPKTKSKGGTINIPIKELEDLTARAVRKYGYNEEETRIIGEVLLYAQLRGNSQGVVKLPGKGIPKNPEADEIAIGA